MSLKIRCSSCRRGTSGKHSLCSDCRAHSTEKIVYVADTGDRIEVTNIDGPSKSSSHSNHRKSKSTRTSAGDRHAGSSNAAYQNSSAGSYRDAGRHLGRDEAAGGTYVRPRVHPYEDRYEYIDANVRYVHPPQTGAYPMNTQMYEAPSSHGGNWQQPSGSYHPQASYAPGRQASGHGSKVNYVYSGTEGPDGEIID